ncbi:G-protein coupled receptor GRL101-like isoform X1 [Haliotis rufescens]|uniref:G-protein coupled receptor GRL101-like isoform X1 n=1 Tax=Haliotis rufescens TaxID=6454 RepID=UPI00201F38C1|nr:G-protein coupled receptor GRL101-like isoform X1 [Haliotis rufescens]
MFIWEDGAPLTFRKWYKDHMMTEPGGSRLEMCTAMLGRTGWHDIGCGDPIGSGFICEKEATNVTRSVGVPVLPVQHNELLHSTSLYMACDNGEIVSSLLRCDGRRDCLDGTDEQECDSECSRDQYKCDNGRCISISLYCDYVNDCGDYSDEEHCVPNPCSGGWSCENGQCISTGERCDMIENCMDGTDEQNCDTCNSFECHDGRCIPNFWKNDDIVDCDGTKREDETCQPEEKPSLNLTEPSNQYPLKIYGTTNLSCLRVPDIFGKVPASFDGNNIDNCSLAECPAGFYTCPGSYCIPVYLVCNGVTDCPRGEDEHQCGLYRCPGYYRCQKSGSSINHCIHANELCDKIYHCPEGDDERFCQNTCPDECSCVGYSIVCEMRMPLISNLPKTARRIEIQNIDMSEMILEFDGFYSLESLKIINCSLKRVPQIFHSLNLQSLDLRENLITEIPEGTFSVPRLKHLELSLNKKFHRIIPGSFSGLGALETLGLSDTDISYLPVDVFQGMPNLKVISMADTDVAIIETGAFNGLSQVNSLNIDDCEVEIFSENMFQGLDHLKILYVDTPAMCCDGVRPQTVQKEECYSENDKISSFSDLIGSDLLRIFLWILAVMAVIGNLAALGFRLIYNRSVLKKGYGIFITNLCVADLIMGLYLVIIGAVGLFYKGTYMWHAYHWKRSILCQFSGILSTVSSEASCLFIFFVTLDRFFATKFPFGEVRFSRRWAVVVSVLTWLTAITFSVTPLMFQDWNFYTDNSVCLALPFSDDMTPEWCYAFAIFVCFNFLVFLLIAFGQLFIYRVVTSHALVKDEKRNAQELAIAKRLFFVAFTDFCCWFPIGVMGLLAAFGTEIADVAFAWTLVFILPVNSALNPLLYTLPLITQMKFFKKSRQKTHRTTDSNKKSSSASNLDVSTLSNDKRDDLNDMKQDGNSLVNKRQRHLTHVYAGVPSDGMERLADVVQSGRVTALDLHQTIRKILDLLHDSSLKDQISPLNDDNVYVMVDKQNITQACLCYVDSSKSTEQRPNSADFTFLLSLMMHILTSS